MHLDNETFRKAFAHGRSMYFDDSEYDAPQVASTMNTLDAVGSVLDEDGKVATALIAWRLAVRSTFWDFSWDR